VRPGLRCILPVDRRVIDTTRMERAMRPGRHDVRQWIAGRSAPLMFALSLAFLVCQAILVVIWVDVPNFSENAIMAIDPTSPEATQQRASLGQEIVDNRIQKTAIFLIMVIWPIVALEAVMHWLTRPWDDRTRKYHFFGLLFCVLPSLRMCARSPEMGERLWLPGLGWRQANKRLRRRLERRFSVPMIMIAFMIMPVLIIEFFMKTQVAQYAWLRMLLHISTGVIWFAFAGEFILMVSVANKKIAYCKKHWVDLAIILLPLFSFLRSLRVLRATQVTKMARIYRLRGTAAKAFRAMILLDVLQRFTGGDFDRRLEKLRRHLADIESEAREIRHKISRLERHRRELESIASEESIDDPVAENIVGSTKQ
jgi:hypothetical protein